MTDRAEIDPLAAASHRNMREHLIAPFAGGAVESEVPLGSSGRAVVDWAAREPLLLVAPRVSLADESWAVLAHLDPDGTNTAIDGLTFDRYSERGSYLALFVPPVDADTRHAAPFELQLALTRDGTPVPAAGLASLLEVRLTEGNLGKLLFVLGAEKQRLRRVGLDVSAQRRLASARGASLDRIGGGVGVARLAARLAWDADASEIVTEPFAEDDASYRRRLAIYRPLLLPNRRRGLELLNGPNGTDGALQASGLASAVALEEADNAFAVSIHLVAAGSSLAEAQAQRDNFLNHLRDTRLLDPTVDVPSFRIVPSSTRQEENELRQRLRTRLGFTSASRAMAPMLARALDRLTRLREALGVSTPLEVHRAQVDDAGSRYVLGLGADLAVSSEAELSQLVSAASAGASSEDPEIDAILGSLHPVAPADDRTAQWLLGPCGLRTVHRVDSGSIYVSHLPTFGLRIVGDAVIGPASPTHRILEAHYSAEGDPDSNVVLTTALASLTSPTGAVHTADAAQIAAWDLAEPPDPGLETAFRAAPLPVVVDLPRFREALARVPVELRVTVELEAGLASDLRAGSVSAIDALRSLVRELTDAGVASIVPLALGDGRVVLVLGAVGLPQVGSNANGRRSTGFRWYAVPLHGAGADVTALGSRSRYTPFGPGLTAVVVVGYARRGATDPYEIRASLEEDDALLDLSQYELLMNILDHLHPMGVEVNTWAVRQRHVDLDGDGVADPLPPSHARTFRPYRSSRLPGGTS